MSVDDRLRQRLELRTVLATLVARFPALTSPGSRVTDDTAKWKAWLLADDDEHDDDKHDDDKDTR